MNKSVKYALFSLGLMAVAQTALAAGEAAAGDPAAGAEKAAVCAACHGADGNSPAPTFPKLAGQGERYLLKQLHDIKAWDTAEADKKATTGRAVPEMTGILANLNDQDLADLAAHFASQTMQLTGAKDLQVKVNSGVIVDGLELGERVFRSGNLAHGVPACTGCHAPTAQGNPPAGFPRLSGQYAEYIEKQLLAFRGGERTNDGDQMIMRMVAEKMSDAEIKAVANFVAGQN